MKTYRCHCGNTLHFENSQCLSCGRAVGFLPDLGVISALEPVDAERWTALRPESGGRVYRMCANYVGAHVCNWLVDDAESESYCRACRLNHIIPNLSAPENWVLWSRVENAKRRLVYTLLSLGLPVIGRDTDPERGLAFQFLEDPAPESEFSDIAGGQQRIMTGYAHGLITINLAEANTSARESMRERMNELYRTLLGHFRHEIGHYYWYRLVEPGDWLQPFRELFGDERADYGEALQRHYNDGPPADWQQRWVSMYASAHPWEDWAETWAHYLHMLDTLETAHDFGFAIRGQTLAQPMTRTVLAQQAPGFNRPTASFSELFGNWISLTVALNALNRSMGLADAYPFVLSPTVEDKLRFVHRLILDATN